MKNVLFLTYYFPPYTNSGVFRPLKMVKYLKRHGDWNPIVVTLNPDLYPNRPIDNSLIKDVPEDLEIHYVNSLEPLDGATQKSQNIFYEIQTPEKAIGSLMHFLFKALEVINSKNIDLIFCTIPPYTLGVVGKMLKEITGIPLVVDYRDGWVNGNELFKFRTTEGKMINTYMEDSMLESANGIVVKDKDLGEIVLKKNQNTPFIVIPNGFDSEDFSETNKLFKGNEDSFTLVWCGFIYKDYTDYFKKIILSIENLNLKGNNLKFIIAGNCQDDSLINVIKDYSFIEYKGYLDFEESLNLIKHADVNIVIDVLSFSTGSKIYNLLPVGKPLLTLYNPVNKYIPNLFENYPGAILLPFTTNVEIISNNLEKLLEYECDNISKKDFIDKYINYEREYHTYKLEEFFHEITYNK